METGADMEANYNLEGNPIMHKNPSLTSSGSVDKDPITQMANGAQVMVYVRDRSRAEG